MTSGEVTQVFVTTDFGQTIPLEIHGSYKVKDIKSRMQKEVRVHAKQQLLTDFHGFELLDESYICDFLIYRDCTLRLGKFRIRFHGEYVIR